MKPDPINFCISCTFSLYSSSSSISSSSHLYKDLVDLERQVFFLWFKGTFNGIFQLMSFPYLISFLPSYLISSWVCRTEFRYHFTQIYIFVSYCSLSVVMIFLFAFKSLLNNIISSTNKQIVTWLFLNTHDHPRTFHTTLFYQVWFDSSYQFAPLCQSIKWFLQTYQLIIHS